VIEAAEVVICLSMVGFVASIMPTADVIDVATPMLTVLLQYVLHKKTVSNYTAGEL